MTVYFVAGAGTDIGKTYVTTLLLRQLITAGREVLALKPVASGVPPDIHSAAFAATDTGMLLGAQGLEPTPANVEACTPWRFERPLSPDMAAAAESRTLALDDVLAWCLARIATAPQGATVLIEGVGGVMSPVTSDALNLDLIKALRCPVILVTGSYLGALSHTLTALETLKAHSVSVEAVVLNESADSTVQLESTLESLRRFARVDAINTVSRGASGFTAEICI
jgi:dethiobiotin synthetase